MGLCVESCHFGRSQLNNPKNKLTIKQNVFCKMEFPADLSNDMVGLYSVIPTYLLGVALAQRLACWPCSLRVIGLILRSSSLSDETINQGIASMT